MSYGPNLLGNQISNVSPYVISASSVYGDYPYYYPWKAFDVDGASTYWASSPSEHNNSWVKVDFGIGNAKKVSQYKITLFGGVYSFDAWTFEGSNDDANWITLDTQINQKLIVGQTPHSFVNTTSYRYYRIHFTVGGGEEFGGLPDLTMHESSALRTVSPMIISFND